MPADLIRFSIHADVAVILIENPPVNALSPGVPEGIEAALKEANAAPAVQAIVIAGAGSTFIAGADIREFPKIASGERPPLNLLPFLLAIEDSQKPVVIAIHGQALGGGLEVALAGHYRVLAPNAQIGQPEVKLGLIPGAAGTQRLPRLAGVPRALEMCVTGSPISARAAVDAGIADKILEGDFLESAIAFARQIGHRPPPKTRDRSEKLKAVPPGIFDAARADARKKFRGFHAPLAAIDAIQAATTLDFTAGCREETRLFRERLFSTEAQALIHVFFGERAVAKIPGLSKDIEPADIRRAAVVGAGTMGAGIAMAYANAGIPVLLKDTTQESLDRALNSIHANYAKSVAKGKLTPEAMAQRLASIAPQLTYAGFDQADILTEAAFESMPIKKQVFVELDKLAKPGAILATNTSSLDIDEIAAATSRPDSVVGTHFFSPANIMRLLEVVRGKSTSSRTLATALAIGRKLGKIAVVANNAHGFIGNRMLEPYFREAQFLIEEGASVEQVNRALYDFGMAMGPLAVDDLAGLDVSWLIRKARAPLAKPGVRVPLVADKLCEEGRFGQKTGRGWSKYDSSRVASPDPETAALIQATARAAGIPQRSISDEEIVERCIYALINEGARVLAEGVALRAVDIDIVYINGYGFPAWRGGPMFYADTVGLKKIVARIEQFEKQHGPDLWSPAPLLQQLAASGKRFADYDKSREA